MFKYNVKMQKIIKSLGCEVRGVDLKIENRLEGNIVLFTYYIVMLLNHVLK